MKKNGGRKSRDTVSLNVKGLNHFSIPKICAIRKGKFAFMKSTEIVKSKRRIFSYPPILWEKMFDPYHSGLYQVIEKL
jgi:hypothetical protein